MKVTFRDCLQLKALSRGVVVAGEKNLDNRIKTVSYTHLDVYKRQAYNL